MRTLAASARKQLVPLCVLAACAVATWTFSCFWQSSFALYRPRINVRQLEVHRIGVTKGTIVYSRELLKTGEYSPLGGIDWRVNVKRETHRASEEIRADTGASILGVRMARFGDSSASASAVWLFVPLWLPFALLALARVIRQSLLRNSSRGGRGFAVKEPV